MAIALKKVRSVKKMLAVCLFMPIRGYPESELSQIRTVRIRTVLYKNCPLSELPQSRTVPNQNCPDSELFVSELSRIRTVRIRTAPNQNYSISMITA
uniref:Uncharacterized protein n=1 Tax=Caenorhabditis japonica TaxID=281687 RepID=A0A8R1IIB1_CAEJA